MSEAKRVSCPSCGGEVAVASAAARVAACPYCGNTLVVNEAAVRALGKMALLSETPSCLAVGWPARLKGRDVRVLGRLQYRYEAGLWDEWWIEHVSDGSHAWISQDEGAYMLETPVDDDDVWVPAFDDVSPGDAVRLGRHHLRVQEKRVATMVGVQGEVPFEVGPDRTMRYLDLAGGGTKATVEFFEDGTHEVFVGVHLGPRDLTSDIPDGAIPEADPAGGPPPWPKPAATRPEGGKPKPILRSAATLAPQRVSCPGCGGSVELRDADGTVMVTCEHCGSGLDVSVPGPARLLWESTTKKLPFPLALGATGRLRGVDWTVIGRVRYEQRDESGSYPWDEVQLLNPTEGHAFLALEEGHWTFFRPLAQPVDADPRRLSTKQKLGHRGQTFKVFERDTAQITYVEGEFTWVAREGDRIHYLDAIRPPWMLSAEWSDDEMEWSLGSYVRARTVAEAFGIAASELPAREGVAPAQPFVRTRGQLVRAIAGAAAAALLLLLALYAGVLADGTEVLGSTGVTSAEYLSEQGWISPAFTLPEGEHICRLDVASRSVDNGWVALGVAFLDEEESVVLGADATVEYYHGRTGGESWSEGSRSDYALFRLTGPMEYRLNVFGEAGEWSRRTGARRMSAGPSIDIAVRRGVLPARYFVVAALLAAAYPAWEMARQILFEGQRWPSD